MVEQSTSQISGVIAAAGLLLPPAPKPTRTCEHRPGGPRGPHT
jgi:hypothetical protein|eukprot:SAG25_NODE_560_length_6917_cov_7.195365_10_plen_43_part_00